MLTKAKRFPSMIRKGFRRIRHKRLTTPLGRLMNHARRPLVVKRSTAAGNKMKKASRQSMGNYAIRSRGIRTG